MRAAWTDDTVDTRRVASLISAGVGRVTCLALDAARVVGFADGFVTVAQDGLTRWEVDLLAVDAAYRGQGIARRLIAASAQQGTALGASVARGLIHIDNTASEHAFGAAGFTPQPGERLLFVSGADPESAAHDPAAFIIPVETFGYSGVWLEGSRSRDAFMAALAARSAGALDIAGSVITPEHAQTAQACGLELVGTYRWWEREMA